MDERTLHLLEVLTGSSVLRVDRPLNDRFEVTLSIDLLCLREKNFGMKFRGLRFCKHDEVLAAVCSAEG